MAKDKVNLQVAIVVIFSFATLAFVFWTKLVFDNNKTGSSREYVIFLATVLLATLLFITYTTMRYQSGRFDLFHPLFYVCWYFFIPQIWMSALYYSDESVPLLLSPKAMLFDRNSSFEYALIVLIVGTVAFGVGFVLPLGKNLAGRIPRNDILESPLSEIKVPLQNLFFLGFAIDILLIVVQAITNATGDISQFSGVLQFLSLFYSIAVFIAWFAFFSKQKGWSFLLILSFVLIGLEFLSRGSRGTLLRSALMILAAYLYSQSNNLSLRVFRRIIIIWLPIIILVLVGGYFFGTSFRSLRLQNSNQDVSFGDIVSLSAGVFDVAGKKGIQDIIDETIVGLTERTQGGLISLSVILTYADQHKAEETAAGSDNKIIGDIINAFIPRFMFPNRATIGDNQHIGQIYYGYARFNPGQTVVGDLFKELGWAGLSVGMLVLGITYRFIYVWLIDQPVLTPLRVAIYFVIIQFTNFENQYSLFYPGLQRFFIFVIVMLVVLHILKQIRSRSNSGSGITNYGGN